MKKLSKKGAVATMNEKKMKGLKGTAFENCTRCDGFRGTIKNGSGPEALCKRALRPVTAEEAIRCNGKAPIPRCAPLPTHSPHPVFEKASRSFRS